VLAACGEKFSASAGSGGAGGASTAGQSGESAGGDAGELAGGSAGSEESAAGTGADAGEAGEGAGAGAGTGGAGGTLGLGGAGGLPPLTNGGAGGALTEPPLPSLGLALWLRADYGIQQKDGRVQTWQDQSGNLAHATQPSVNMRPLYLATGFNGRPTLEFDGQGQFLAFAAGFGDFSTGLSGFIVAKPTKADCASMLEFSNGSEIDDIAMGMFENKWTYEVEANFLQAGDIDLHRFTLYGATHRLLGTTELRVNGSVIGTRDMPLPLVPGSGVRVNNFVGHTLYGANCEYYRGQISEIILYSRPLLNSDMSAIEKYLDGHWKLSEQDTPEPTP